MLTSRTRGLTFALACALTFGLLALPAVAEDEGIAWEAFENLKDLEGTWEGKEGTHIFALSANGTVVMETMFPNSPHEMINMYHLDGDDLVMTHYCAGGNQPTMKLAEGSTATDMSFEFTGGSNMDPEKDNHIHAGRVKVKENGELESSWIPYSEGKKAGEMTMTLKRAEG